MSFSRSSSNQDTDPAPALIGIPDVYRLLIRLLVAVPMFFYQAKLQTAQAWIYLWDQKEWPLLEAMKEMNLPQPTVTATALIFVMLFSPIAILVGFLTRVNAVLLLLATAYFFVSGLPLSDFLSGQTYVLYLGLCAVMVLCGPGAFSMDAAFGFLRRRRKQRKNSTL
jgi:uncharacterized membrane protein YphA (DoxX/SURF4 family)